VIDHHDQVFSRFQSPRHKFQPQGFWPNSRKTLAPKVERIATSSNNKRAKDFISKPYYTSPAKKLGESKSIIVIEPQVTGRQRVLFADGIITELLPEQIERLTKE